jgi:hypothetical protein
MRIYIDNGMISVKNPSGGTTFETEVLIFNSEFGKEEERWSVPIKDFVSYLRRLKEQKSV